MVPVPRAYAAWEAFGEGVTAGQAVAAGTIGGFASGAVASGTAKGALLGAFTGAVGSGILQSSLAGTWAGMAVNATASGITSELNGGRFGSGFLSAGLSAVLAPHMETGNSFQDGLSAAVVGGTISSMTGGKFANGAVTAAFNSAFGALASRGASSGGEALVDDVTVTGCTRSEGALPAPGGNASFVPDYSSAAGASGYGNPMMDLAARAALAHLPDSTVGEWTGYLQWRGPGYVASAPTLVVAQPVGRCYQATFSMPSDAVGIYHSHMRFGPDVRGYRAMNNALNYPGPKDHWPLYRSTPIPNYFRGANHAIFAIESRQYFPQLYTQRGI